jgi:predicted secreted protein
MSDAIAGVGTIIQKWDGASAWDRIAEVTNISGPGMSREMIDVTSLDSTSGYREFIAGFRDAGTIVLSMNFTRAGLDMFLTDFESNDVQNYEIVLPDTDKTSLEFEGLVQEFPLTIPTDSQVTMEVTIKVTGQVTVNSGSNSTAPA